MSADMGYIVAGWAITLATLGIYSFSLVVRGRRLNRHVPEERRRWTS